MAVLELVLFLRAAIDVHAAVRVEAAGHVEAAVFVGAAAVQLEDAVPAESAVLVKAVFPDVLVSDAPQADIALPPVEVSVISLHESDLDLSL